MKQSISFHSRILAILVIFEMAGTSAWAVPANSNPFTYTQPDGTTIVLRLIGDEFAHAYLTTEGKEAVIDEDGYVNSTKYSRTDAIRRIRAQRANVQRQLPIRKAEVQDLPTRGLIILVNFSNLAFENTTEAISHQMNDEGYSLNGATGSARDYFTDQSSGTFCPSFDVVGPVTLEFPMRYYGGNLADGSDRNAEEMIFSATKLAAEQGLVNLADYDQDHDGLIDMVYIIFAGKGEADGGSADSIWPFMNDMQSEAKYAYQQIQGKRIGLHACSAERRGDGSFSGIGTFCHEFSHCLGLPDLYDVDYSGGYGMGYYDIMSSGAYLNNGNTPPSYTAFERWSMGWLDYIDVTETQHIVLEAVDQSNTAYRLTTGNPNEYFTLENRQQQGWDTYLPARGLLISHIDYDEEAWLMNTVNDDPNHERVRIMAADNTWSRSTATGDLYPGLLNNTTFSDESMPASLLWDGSPLGKPVTHIAMVGKTVSFDVTVSQELSVSHVSQDLSHCAVYNLDGKRVVTSENLPVAPSQGMKYAVGNKILIIKAAR